MVDYLLVFSTALGAVVVTTPVARWLSREVGAVDRPGGRRIHTRPTARLGGLALFAGFLAAVAVATRLETFEAVFATTSDMVAILLATIVIVTVGLVDDLWGMRAPAKLAGQVLAAGVLVLFGVVLRFVYIPGLPGSTGSLLVVTPDLGALLTVVAIVAMINAVNLVDGLDGLAAGIVAIAAIALFTYVHMTDPAFLGVGLASSSELVFAALAGVCIGFLLFNFHPASVFMGDSGAMLLGLLLGSAGVLAIGGRIQPRGSDFAALSIPVLVPALVLAVPFFDTTWTILRRLRSGRAVFSPDKKHLHHRLVEIGHSHRRAVLIMYYWSALLAFAAVGVGLLPLLVVTGAVAAGVLAAALYMLGGRVRRSSHQVAVRASNFVFSFTKSRGEPAETTSDLRKRDSRRL